MASVSLQSCFVRHVAVPNSSGDRFNLELQIQLLHCKDLVRCLHDEISSLILFRMQRCGSKIIISFSFKYRLHLFEALLYGETRDIILHTILNSVLLSLRDHIYLFSSVEFLDLMLRKDAMCSCSET